MTIYLIMGVSGSGKSTIGRALSQELGYSFYDGDDFHSPENVQKMSQNIPLTDSDRLPWLQAIRKIIDQHQQQKKTL